MENNATVFMNPVARKKTITDDDYEWPFQLSFDIAKSGQAKIAFLSGEERKYYPESPGHSKLGVMTALNTHKGDTPNPTYIPPSMGHILKPISNKGYGIGGLSADRFPIHKKTLQEKRPEPGTYQKIHMYPSRPKLDDKTNPMLRTQCIVSFGSHISSSRFGLDEEIKSPGPGTYDLSKYGQNNKSISSIKAHESFGSKKCIIPTVVTVCRYNGGEACLKCGGEQLHDYYRSKRPMIGLPGLKPGKANYAVLCRQCYCSIWIANYNSKKTATNVNNLNWSKKQLETLFYKVRNCTYKHEHQGLPNKITTSTSKEIDRLTRKEILLAKYYGDSVPPHQKTTTLTSTSSTSS